MTARTTIGILLEIGDLEAKREKLVEELRKHVWNDSPVGERVGNDRRVRTLAATIADDDELDRRIRTDPVLRDIFLPAANLMARLGESEIIEANGCRYFLTRKRAPAEGGPSAAGREAYEPMPLRPGVDGNPKVRCASKDGCIKHYPDCVRAGECQFGVIEF